MIMENYNISKPTMLICLLTLALISCDTNIGQINTDDIPLPPGFIIETYSNVSNARSMALSENGILFVGTRSSDKVYAVVDNDNDISHILCPVANNKNPVDYNCVPSFYPHFKVTHIKERR